MPECEGVIEFGGEGRPIVLLHGLMGRATTWWQTARWLTEYGRVVGFDARGHGRSPRRGGWRTEEFAEDVAQLITDIGAGPAIVIGHSMGGLHALVLAATRPELVTAVVVEDMAPDQRGRTVDAWRGYFESWPVPFRSLAHVREFFGSTGDYFTECVEEKQDGYHLIANLDDLYLIAREWGRRDYWSYVDKVECPVLVVEAEHTFMPEGQQAELARRVPGGGKHLVVAGAGHVVHDDAPLEYRGAVEAFLSEVLAR
ncbi:hydrolase [Prauserella marina]|uniref:Pimeloyl-ACP methyl ester carboxylesterase n=1 Tax=Prauserella marina TaxID=530584 RepID=A0A222VWR0_9PSEU|nr:alpha/beta hydrolase [Prauserella marina]ASR38347.1 hydrolase [Prauserella marina]PWV78435.1 pimeloyl-ACP methyl ester carboxylesterase [Prauserella marina]SDC85927.1 Pimeloyl-ACP methyl ester carboxylesterase [Prauserella marina]